MALICAEPPTRDTDEPASMAGRIPRIEETITKEDLSISDRNHVGCDIG